MSEQDERERMGRKRNDGDEPDVEAHRFRPRNAHEDAPDDTKKDEEPEVEAHRFRPRN